jgi:peptidoglycan/xylan/chitin deacetylase (PgdA/CDA1 family)
MAGTASASKRALRFAARVAGLPVAFVAARLLRLSSRRAGVALAYHSIASRPGDPAVELVPPHQAELFDAHLRHLAGTYRVVPAAELPEAIAGRRRGGRFPVALTFDDDLESHVTLAVPLLLRRRIHGTFFLTGASLHAPFGFWWERLQRAVDDRDRRLGSLCREVGLPSPGDGAEAIHALGRAIERLNVDDRETFSRLLGELEPDPDRENPGLRTAQVRSLVGDGMTVGFHTRRHHPLPDLPDELLERAMHEGREELEGAAGVPVTVIGYPHGRADARVAAAARAAGFLTGYTGVSEAVGEASDRLLLGRLNPSYRSVGHLALQVVLALGRAHR